MKNIVCGSLSLVCALCFVGACGGATPEANSAHEAHACTCSQGKAGENTWCDKCGHGYVDGKKVGCKGCYKAKTGGEGCADCAKPKAEEAPAEEAPAEEAPAEEAPAEEAPTKS